MGVFDGLFDGEGTGDAELDQMMASLVELQTAAAQSAKQMANDTADAWSRDRLAHVWVNGRGVVIQVEFADQQFEGATATEAAAAVVEATQAAAGEMQTKMDAAGAQLWEQARGLGVGDVTGKDEFEQFQPKVSLSPPNSRERLDAANALAAESEPQTSREDPDDDGGYQFTVSVRN
ncbi:hypothetical protein [Mycobacteroides chelonae]|uniref:hypothetical protein n=1 Tax=Mycobacteroides chelonae TaxID=1774 RepID=UPI0008AA557E|nr:hypothetical protein [Mycobacteroides chelonae]OHU48766.1 hypothetical protein BKG81_15160 [Mycobacteroides chelonae]